MTERRFSDAETAWILERAARASLETPADGDSTASRGVSLAQLQEVARESGLDLAAVTHAASQVARGDLVPTTRHSSIGVPLGVARTIELDRGVSDAEWQRLVQELRELFEARGVVSQEGTLREWRNGNLRVSVEPTEYGSRLRLRTIRRDARMLLQLGAALAALLAATGGLADPTTPWWSAALISGMGIVSMSATAIRQFRWAKRRSAQMQQFSEIAATVVRD